MLEQIWKYICRLALDDKKSGIQFPQTGVKILKTLKKKPENIKRNAKSWKMLRKRKTNKRQRLSKMSTLANSRKHQSNYFAEHSKGGRRNYK